MVQAQECLSPKGKKPSVENEVVGVILPGQAYPIEVFVRRAYRPTAQKKAHLPTNLAIDTAVALKLQQS